MDTNSGYKDRALATLSDNWVKGVVATMLCLLIESMGDITLSMLLGTDQQISFLWTLACLPLSWGFLVFFLDMARGKNVDYGQLFDGYKDFGRIFIAYLLMCLAVVIGTVLFIVPGIIAGLMLSQTSFILKDDKEIGAIDALRKSAEMMQGHKMDLFLLMLSFFGWIILTVCTLGLGLLLLLPYMETTLAHFYEDLKAEQI